MKYVDSPPLHWMLCDAGFIPVASDDPGAVASAVTAAVRALRNGRLVEISPEGTRSPNGRLHRGKADVAAIAALSGQHVATDVTPSSA